MQEAGGRRIKRSLFIDQTSIGFLSEEDKSRLRKFKILTQYLDDKEQDIKSWNEKLVSEGHDPINSRNVTNIGTFRAYVQKYLESHPQIHQDMTLMVRQLSPTAQGLPLEIYCFTKTIAWVDYEGIQADIFDHLLAILPAFGLNVFQETSGQDLRVSMREFSHRSLQS